MSHLQEIDRERARLAGLDRMVKLPPFPRPRLTAFGALAAGVAAVLSFGLLWELQPERYTESELFGLWTVVSAAFWGVVVAFAVVAVALNRWVMSVAQFRRLRVALVGGLMMLAVPFAMANFFQFLSGSAVFIAATGALFVLWGGSTAVVAVALTTPIAPVADLAGRAQHARVLAGAMRGGLAVNMILSGAGIPTVVIGNAVGDTIGEGTFSFVRVLSFAAFAGGTGLALYLWADSKLTHVFVDLERELAELPSEYSRNAGIDRGRERLARPVVAFLLLLPIIVALPIALWAALR